MSHFDFIRSNELERRDEPFFGLVMAAMRRADSDNADLLRLAFPDTWAELAARYHAPAGHVDGDHNPDVCVICAEMLTPNRTETKGTR